MTDLSKIRVTDRHRYTPIYIFNDKYYIFDKTNNLILLIYKDENSNWIKLKSYESDISTWEDKILRNTLISSFNTIAEDLIVEDIKSNDKLNPVIWDDDGHLKPDVREKILQIANEFKSSISDFIDLNIIDIEIVGSNAAYNYTDKSDIDVHIITDFNDYGNPDELVQAAMNANKANFNRSYDIDFKGYNVEVYVQDIKSTVTSNGIYSVFEDRWIKEPVKLDIPDIDLEPELSEKIKEANKLLKSGTYEDIRKYIDSLYILRRHGLAQDGEYSKGNLIFKEIRNLDLLDNLKSKLVDLRSKELSIESI